MRISILPFVLAVSSLCPTADAQTLIVSDTVLTQDHVGAFRFAADDVSLDCAGHTITSPIPGTGTGVHSGGHSGLTVQNCHVTGFFRDFAIQFSSNVMLTNNSVTAAFLGFDIFGSNGIILTGNTASDNTFGIAANSSGSFYKSNTANDNVEAGFFINASEINRFIDNVVFDNFEFGFRLINASIRNNFKLNMACDNGHGLLNRDVTVTPDSLDNNFRNNDFCSTTPIGL